MEQPIIDPSKVSALVAGGLGAFLSVLFQRNASRWSIFTTLTTAEIVCFYIAHPLWSVMHEKISWVDDQWQGPISLSLGLVSIFIVGGVTKMASDFWGNPWKTIGDFIVNILGRLLPGKKEP